MTAAVINDQTINAPLVLEGANARYTFANDSANALNFAGGITGGTAGATVLTLSGNGSGTNTISGAIGNGAATTVALFVASGADAWVLSGNNSFTGGVTIDGGMLRVGSVGALNSASPNTVTFTNITTPAFHDYRIHADSRRGGRRTMPIRCLDLHGRFSIATPSRDAHA